MKICYGRAEMEHSMKIVLLITLVSLLAQELVHGTPQNKPVGGKRAGKGKAVKAVDNVGQCPKRGKAVPVNANKSLNETQDAALAEINKHRSEYEAPALGPETGLFSNAQKCAEYYAERGIFGDNSCPYSNGAGEVVRGCKGAEQWNVFDYGKKAIEKWMDQAKDFDYSKPSFSDATKCFTQLVWKGSKNFGFGCACKKGNLAAVGLFEPAGNTLTDFVANVVKPINNNTLFNKVNGKYKEKLFTYSQILAFLKEPDGDKHQQWNPRCFGEAKEVYQQEALNLHNFYRAKHLTPAVALNASLNALAIQCANYYVEKGIIDHSCPHKNATITGENLFSSKGSWIAEDFAKIAVDTWYNEGNEYDYDKPVYSKKTGNFTQLVWAYTRELGFGYSKSNDYYVAVALYNPKGNARGHFENNGLSP
ncbi:Golgi-associated plant pathogenesis-related protein 1 [Orchesella cincta]|uniref:Golgi-associated plant pathogenesis-related protein 1 n=1 Tax=Orchesella cincta TaxID=48709 RepID=A0A1D2MIS5_ORCCI|nr:Golgi-associated plant pathogenesis-related protein 1 [Orchesella cincta]